VSDPRGHDYPGTEPLVSLTPDPGEVGDLRWAARLAARLLMRRSHGCTGPGCRSRRHRADAQGLDTALKALGFRDDPDTNWRPGPGYHVPPEDKRRAATS